MTTFGHSMALVALLGAMPLQAAPDTGLILLDTGIGRRSTGIGATVGVRIQLGPDRVVRKSERVKLGVSAGPVMMIPDSTAHNGMRRGQASLVSIDLKPGYTASLNFAGQSTLVQYTRLGAAEKNEDDDDNKQSTGDKVAWVAAVAAVMAVGIFFICVHDTECAGSQ